MRVEWMYLCGRTRVGRAIVSFFFSSRRRHTIFDCDWSSDVCSSDLVRGVVGGGLPWILTAGTGSLKRDGHLMVRVRGLVLVRQSLVPPALQDTKDRKSVV